MHRRSWLLGLVLAASLAQAAPPLPMRVLLFTLSAGFKHGSIPVAEQVMTDLGKQTGLFDTVVSQDVNDLSAANLAGYQIVFFYTTGNLPMNDAQKAALLNYVKGGGGFMGVHSATDCNYTWPEYGELIGGYFDGHPWTQPVTIRVEDKQHAVTEGLDDTFVIRDEIYQQRNWSRDKVHVLMTLDPASVDLTRPGVHRTDKDFGIAWCKDYGQGRVFYTGLGHFDEVWRDRRFQRQLLGAVKWLTRLDWRSDPAISALLAKQDVKGLSDLIGTLPESLRGEPVAAIGSLDTPVAATRLGELAAADQLVDVRLAALKTLGAMKTGGIQPILAALSAPDSSPMIRATAVRALGQRGTAEAEAKVTGALQDAAPQVRLAAVEALGKFRSPTARDALLGMVRGDETRLQRPALDALSTDDAAVVTALVAVLAAADAAHADLLPAVVDKLTPLAKQDAVFAALKATAERTGNDAAASASVRAIAASGRPEVPDLLLGWIFGSSAAVSRAATSASAGVNLDLKGKLTPFIGQWWAIGPFANPGGRSAHNKAFGPEQGIDLKASYDGQGGKAAWVKADAPGGRLDFLKLFKPGNNVLGYAYVIVRAAKETACELRLGSDDGCKVWLNGQQILSRDVPRGMTIDDDRVPVTLKAGDNPLLIKVMQGMGDWTLQVRFGKAEGGLDGLSFVVPE